MKKKGRSQNAECGVKEGIAFHSSFCTLHSSLLFIPHPSSLIPAFLRVFILLLVMSLSSAGSLSQSARPASALAFTLLKVGRLLDVRTGAVLLNQGVLVEGERIRAVGKFQTVRRRAPRGVRVIDLGRATVLPGLIDCHTHLLLASDGRLDTTAQMSDDERQKLAARNAREMLEAGITTARNVGHSGVRGDAELRDSVNAGQIRGPRILAATRKLTPPGGQPLASNPATPEILKKDFLTIAGVDEARQAVREAVAAGADVIKVVVDVGPKLLSLDELKAIVDEAHGRKIKVAAHATTAEGTKRAAEAGVDSIEHGTDASDETFRLMAARGIFLVPTDYTAESIWQIFAADVRRNPQEREDFEAYIKSYSEKTPQRFERALLAKVRIAAGSDMYFVFPGKTRGQASLLVLDALRREGLAPMEIVRAATLNAAELLGWQDRVGTIEAGKFADIIAVDDDPLKNMLEFQRVRFVMKGGVVIKNELAGKSPK